MTARLLNSAFRRQRALWAARLRPIQYRDLVSGDRLNICHTPASVAASFGPYSHAVEVPERSRLLYISSEVGVLPDGTLPEGIEARAEACLAQYHRNPR
jgi:enamine deaminase RidA (YjgF/YER057c/UK114 family)